MPATAPRNEEIKITLQVGAELRIRSNGEVVLDNPEIEVAYDDRAADATLLYRFDPETGEHVLRLLDPVADHRHMKVHRPND
ncbi:MAG TPA: hypothetical protein VJP87_12465 [Candidatus Acidoferrales bacterium]|nr:hypothetical protein [Candidatus Acidoferrales bacterium]